MTSPAEKALRGRAARKQVTRASHGQWTTAEDRPDPLDGLERQAADRIVELLPIRYGRMADSPFAFLRGAAAVMAADLAAQPHTGLTVQLCGDAHLLNFGLFASPDRALLFDLNDFDETLPGPFEWDVKRLAASTAVAAREGGHGDDRAWQSALATARAYRSSMRRLAELGELAVWYQRFDTAEVLPLIRETKLRSRVEASLARTRRRTSLHALAKLTETREGRRHIVHDPPYSSRSPHPTARPSARSSANTAAHSPKSDAFCSTATGSSKQHGRQSASGASAPAASSSC